MLRSLLFVLLSLILLNSNVVFADSNVKPPSLDLTNGWVRMGPPTVKMLAGYGALKNTSERTLKIVSVKSPFFQKVTMHHSMLDHGMMKMGEIKQLILKPNESILFKPNGRHFMMMKPLKAIKKGMAIPIEIKLNSGESYRFVMEVRR